MEQPQQQPASSVVSQLSDQTGLLKFLGGLVLGLVARSLGSLLLEGGQPEPKQSKSRLRARPSAEPAAAAAPQPALRPREELKMVLCVNMGLGMGKGKIGAQCAHAAVGVIGSYRSGSEAMFRAWERCGQPKIALKIKDEAEMAALASKALSMGLPAYIVHDAGRTQIAAGSQTVLAIGPAYKSVVDQVTGHLSLL